MQIELVDSLSASEISQCDFSFDVNCEATAPFGADNFQQVVPVTPYRKCYDFEPAQFADCSAGGDRLLAVAKQADEIKGYVLASRGWNNYALIDDFAVDRGARKSGVGQLLVNAVVKWSVDQRLPGIRAETQTNNVPACRFYHRYGFELGGFDRHLYSTLRSHQSETALFWYLFL